MPKTKSFPARLKGLRAAAGLTQDELARRTGVRRLSVSQWECGRRAPSLATARRIAQALGVSVDELAGVT